MGERKLWLAANTTAAALLSSGHHGNGQGFAVGGGQVGIELVKCLQKNP
jgi:hypothetical protein